MYLTLVTLPATCTANLLRASLRQSSHIAQLSSAKFTRVASSNILNDTKSKKLRKSFSTNRNCLSTKYPLSGYNDYKEQRGYATLAALSLGAGCLAVLSEYFKREKAQCKQKPIPQLTYEPGSVVDKLPTYTSAQVKEHDSIDKGVWVTFKNGVYDVTKFVKWHPGGDKILLAAGGSLEPFFSLFAIHQTKEVMEIMESMRIGNIFDSETPKEQDAYKDDPRRSGVLRINSAKPFNAEPPKALLTDSYITPNELHFVRNHLPVPRVDEKTLSDYKLEGISEVADNKSSSLALDAIKILPKHEVTVTLQCAGNRRAAMSKVKEVKGLTWDCGSISTATWAGANLIDVLTAMGFTKDELKGKHIQFEGMDTDPTGASYGASIPAEKALDPLASVLIAYEMNGEPIPEDHGYPLRVIIPGVVGARNVKWLNKIVISDEESHSHWQRNDYKTFHPSVTFESSNFDEEEAIQETPVQSVICEPSDGAAIDADEDHVTIKGYAFSGGGRAIIRVDLSIDGGKTWFKADLNNMDQTRYHAWAWTLWETTVAVPKDHKGKLEIVCKAIDAAHNVQPEKVDGIWNIRGLLNNSWHRITVNVKS